CALRALPRGAGRRVAEARKAVAQGAAAAGGAGGGGARPCQGSLLLRKRTERAARLTWRAAARGRHPARLPLRTLLRYGMKECVINVTSENSPRFKFLAWEFYSPKLSAENVDGIPVGDGAMLILDAESKAGVVEVARAFLASPGVQPSLVPEGWVENHFRWLVWKLATTERSFPQLFAGRCLTPNVLLLQLKYRYDRELDCCERPALRRILEKDDAPGKPGTQNKNESDSPATVASVDERFSSDCELLLTDGWYSVTGAVDREMCRLVHSGQVAVGTKLITHGAELVNCDEGCSPLEAPSAVRLKLHTNSTRRACWDARLGFQNCTGPFPVQLNSVLPNGGLVGCVRVLISRVYPVMYLEKLSNGKSVARTERAEMRVAAHFEQQRQLKLEQLYSQERAKFSQERRGKRRVSVRELAQITSGHELCELLDSDPDPSSLQSLLTEEQQNAVREFQQGYRDQLTRELQSRIQQQLGEEKSTSRNVVCVLKIRCLDVKTRDSSKTALLSVWRPSEEAVNLLKEGCMVKLFSVTAHGNRMGSLQLSTGRQTRYCPVPLPRLVPYFQRRVSSFDEILSPNFQPPFNEMDTVGLIVHVGSGPQSSHFETMYLADADMRIIGVSFWGGMKEFGWEDLLRPNSFVAASNLQWRQNSITQRVICTYASEFSTFTKSPKQILLKEALDDLKYNIQMDLKQFSSACKELIFSHINGKLTGESSSYQKEKQVTPLSARSHSALSEVPEEDVKETPVRKKLRKLEQYADPPPISPLFLPSPGLSLKKQFHIPSKNPPCASSNILCKPVVESVENDESPPLSLDEPG
ncbi:uncharacterized protein GBIM_05307, partial [Gryllus bimaculatus]